MEDAMDTVGIIIMAISVVLYFAIKKKPIFLFTGGVGLGILIGALWAYWIVLRAF